MGLLKFFAIPVQKIISNKNFTLLNYLIESRLPSGGHLSDAILDLLLIYVRRRLKSRVCS
jgi:hypothetical protein